MSKVNLNDLASLESQTSALATIASNNSAISEAFDNTLSRDGSGPNQMEAPLDLNGNEIVNSPTIARLTAASQGLNATDLELVREAPAYARQAASSAILAASYVGAVTSSPTWTTARSLTLSGPVTGTVSGVDGSADITLTTSLSSAAIVASLGYTPVNQAGDTLQGPLGLPTGRVMAVVDAGNLSTAAGRWSFGTSVPSLSVGEFFGLYT